MVILFFSLFAGLVLIIALIRAWIVNGHQRITEIYTCHCGSGSHYWLSEKKLECNKCGMVKDVNSNGIIIGEVIQTN